MSKRNKRRGNQLVAGNGGQQVANYSGRAGEYTFDVQQTRQVNHTRYADREVIDVYETKRTRIEKRDVQVSGQRRLGRF